MPITIPPDLADDFTLAPDGAWELTVAPAALRESLLWLGQERQPAFDYLIDLFAVDYGEEFEVIYHLSRVQAPEIVRVKTRVPRRGGTVPTVTDVWPGASWPEREMMEMYGIIVENHPAPRHLLLPEGWKGYPLRKDYEYPKDHPYLRKEAAGATPRDA